MQKILFILLLVSFTSFGQEYSKLIDDKEITNFINWKLVNDTFKNGNVPKQFFSFSRRIIKWKQVILKYDSSKTKAENEGSSIYNERTKFLDSILSSDDRGFMIKQSDSYLNNEWTFALESTNAEKANYKYFFSLPLFSLNKQYAILKEVYNFGQTCGEERIILYKRTEKGWIWYHWLTGGDY